MSNTLSVKVAVRKAEEGQTFEGVVSIAGLKPTKLARKSDGSTHFPSRAAVNTAARNVAKALGFADVDLGDKVEAGEKVAAKKAPAKKAVAAKKPGRKAKAPAEAAPEQPQV